MQLPATGGCRCERLRFEISAKPILTTACHCRGCQRMTGAPFSLSISLPAEAFCVLQGDEVAGGVDHGFGHRFCRSCLSWVFTRPRGLDWVVNVRTTMLDDVPATPPFVETCTIEGLPWARTTALHSFSSSPTMEQWGELAEAFAAS